MLRFIRFFIFSSIFIIFTSCNKVNLFSSEKFISNQTFVIYKNTKKNIINIDTTGLERPVYHPHNDKPHNGIIVNRPPILLYTPNKNYVGDDNLSFYVNNHSGCLVDENAIEYGVLTIHISVVEGNKTDILSPIFKSKVEISVPENQKSVIRLLATDTSIVEYSIFGDESRFFELNQSTGVLQFIIPVNFEKKSEYNILTVATDASRNKSKQALKIKILDIPIEKVKKTGQTNSYDVNGSIISDLSIKDDGFYRVGVETNFTRDDKRNLVIDNLRGLMWIDDINQSKIKKRWITKENAQREDDSNTTGDTAITFCNNLVFQGYDDWRLPSRKELLDLSDYSQHNPAISPVFKNMNFEEKTVYGYWSSTVYRDDNFFVWGVNFFAGVQTLNQKNYNLYVKCVRTNL